MAASCRAGFRIFRLFRVPFLRTFNQTDLKRAYPCVLKSPFVFGHCRGIVPRTAVLAGVLSFLGLGDSKEEDTLIVTIKMGILNLQQQDYKKAESILHVALKMAQERMDPQAETYIFDILANVAYEKGEYLKAEKLFVDVMQRAISSGTPRDDNSIVEMSLKLAQIYSQTNDIEKAEQGFQFCIDTQQKKLEGIDYADSAVKLTEAETNNLVLWAMSMEGYGRYLLEQTRFQKARECFEQALKVSEKVNGPSHEVTLALLNDIGAVATLLQDYNTAIALLRETIARAQSVQSPELAAFYCNLGGVFMEQGQDLEEAKRACTKASKLAKSTNHREAAARSQECLEELRKHATV
ncbi:tetratricopeptide repeat protein 19, mitochondrial [Ixodes scapularis]